MMRDPKMLPIPAPEPATPTVAAPAPMNLAAESMSRETAEVCRARTGAAETRDCSAGVFWANRALLTGRRYN